MHKRWGLSLTVRDERVGLEATRRANATLPSWYRARQGRADHGTAKHCRPRIYRRLLLQMRIKE
eukprot:scaffold34638_cov161-Amphora_coffeaeformis.AAC.18